MKNKVILVSGCDTFASALSKILLQEKDKVLIISSLESKEKEIKNEFPDFNFIKQDVFPEKEPSKFISKSKNNWKK